MGVFGKRKSFLRNMFFGNDLIVENTFKNMFFGVWLNNEKEKYLEEFFLITKIK